MLVVGELCVDIVVDLGGGELRFGQHEQIVPATTLTMGSSSAITACGAATLGLPTELVSARGDDMFGLFLRDELKLRGVGQQHVSVHDGIPTGASTHLTRPGGDRTILTSLGTIGMTTNADVSDAMLAAAAGLHIGSYFLQHALHNGGAVELFRRARAGGLRTSLDGNFDPTERWDSGILELLQHTDVFFGNDEELCGITGKQDLMAAARAALSQMPPGGVIIAKLGADGAVAVTQRGEITVKTPDLPGEVLDTVGAGDTLAAGTLTGLLRGDTLADALALGVACGTASTRGAGGVAAQPSLAAAHAIRSGMVSGQPYSQRAIRYTEYPEELC
nr:carbohydrate kinase family protein [Leucobacter aridicollis]